MNCIPSTHTHDSFTATVINTLNQRIETDADRHSFFINDKFYTYAELGRHVNGIREALKEIQTLGIGLVAHDDIQTYAAIIALWSEGKYYVPLHPHQPMERCLNIIEQVGITTILDSSAQSRYAAIPSVQVIPTSDLTSIMQRPALSCGDAELAYILFTSGSTGHPKGVTISRGNLAAFVSAFHQLGFTLNQNDRCLQMFDLTFDLSVQSYLMPLLGGACVYTVGNDCIKYQAVFQLLDDHHLTFTLMVPSMIHYLRPYMDELDIPEMRLSLFCGEALPLDDTLAWSHCVPRAEIHNVYGPTENTIYCTDYMVNTNGGNKQSNGIVCIGHAMPGTQIIVVNDQIQPVPSGEKGELCLAGDQLTPGYWNDEEKNKTAFFIHQGTRYYHTGDVCSMDEEGDISYYGRMDAQIKIQGYRIELSEIECVARQIYEDQRSVVAIPIADDRGNHSIILAVEHEEDGSADLLSQHLKRLLPSYMLPQSIHFIPTFPLNVNNKIDRKAIRQLLTKA